MLTVYGGRILAGLLGQALDEGRCRLEGDKVMVGGEQVTPKLDFVRDDGQPATATPSTPASTGIRLSATTDNHEEPDMALKVATLPASSLPSKDQAAADRSRLAAARTPAQIKQGVRKFRWPKGSMPLPENKLLKRSE